MENWFLPLTILPSVGFFIMATSGVSNALSAEIARLVELDRESNMITLRKKIRQLRLINISLVLLYASAVTLSIAGLISGLQFNFMYHGLTLMVEVLVCIGIGLTVFALILLMIYAIRAVSIKEHQFKGLDH